LTVSGNRTTVPAYAIDGSLPQLCRPKRHDAAAGDHAADGRAALLDGVRYFRLEDRPAALGSGFHVGKPSREKLAQALRSQIAEAKAPRGRSPQWMLMGR
jgi:hypothetical protein